MNVEKTGLFIAELISGERATPETAAKQSNSALAAAIVLKFQPNGVIMWWATPPGVESKPSWYSCFYPLSFGVGIFPPFITALLTVDVTIFTCIVMLLGKRFTKLRNALLVCIIVTAVVSLCPVLYGFKFITAIGALITLMLVISAIFRAAANSTRQ